MDDAYLLMGLDCCMEWCRIMQKRGATGREIIEYGYPNVRLYGLEAMRRGLL